MLGGWSLFMATTGRGGGIKWGQKFECKCRILVLCDPGRGQVTWKVEIWNLPFRIRSKSHVFSLRMELTFRFILNFSECRHYANRKCITSFVNITRIFLKKCFAFCMTSGTNLTSEKNEQTYQSTDNWFGLINTYIDKQQTYRQLLSPDSWTIDNSGRWPRLPFQELTFRAEWVKNTKFMH